MQNGFAQTIRAERKRLQMSQADFAERVGCSVATLKRWESGQTVPHAAHLDAVLRAAQGRRAVTEPTTGFHPGWWLRIARGQKRLTIREAAEKVNLSSSCWHRYESGEAPLSARQSVNLAHSLGYPTATPTTAAAAQNRPLPIAGVALAHNPILGIHILVNAMLDERFSQTSPEWFRAHELLAGCLICVGEYDLAGQAFSTAIRSCSNRATDYGLDAKRAHLATAWTGFRLSESPKTSLKRLQWLDSQLAKVTQTERDNHAMTRAIYADRAERPDFAWSIVKEMATSQDETQSCLLTAWLGAKYGDPKKSLARVEHILEHSNVNTRFAAHKISMLAHLALRDLENAVSHHEALRSMETNFGLRLTGISASQRRKVEAKASE